MMRGKNNPRIIVVREMKVYSLNMQTYLIGLMYHESECLQRWNAGMIEDYEASTGIYIEAESEENALIWAEQIAIELMRHVNNDPNVDWKEFGYFCWTVPNPEQSDWVHCLSFFQHVKFGSHPDYSQMGIKAYQRWLEVTGKG
jgi:hypothetical protein